MSRLRVLYLVPGHDLLSSAGPTRNVLSLAEAWSATADVTLAFRRAAERPATQALRVLEMDPRAVPPEDPGDAAGKRDDAAVRGMAVTQLWRYLKSLRAFVEEHAARYDVVLEKSWLFSGLLCQHARRRGVPGAVVENVVRVFAPPAQGTALRRRASGYLRHRLIQARVGVLLRRTHVLAETQELKDALVRHLGLRPARVGVVGLGVDHDRFQPADREEARRELGLSGERPLALYFGALDRTHDLAPLLRALADRNAAPDAGSAAGPPLRLHVLGDGECRAVYEALAARAAPGTVVFHGRLPHERVPRYIAASDLCVAPYDPACFPDGEIAYSTLKIPEAMACARPVVSVASGNVRRLIQHGRSGLLLENRTEAWSELLSDFPGPDRLSAMGTAARASVLDLTWKRTSEGYHAFCESLRSVPLSTQRR